MQQTCRTSASCTLFTRPQLAEPGCRWLKSWHRVDILRRGYLMNNTLLCYFAGSLAGSLLVGGTALAADLPTRKPAPPPLEVIPPISWTGFYASAEGGYAWDGSIVYIGPWNKGFGDTGAFGGANVGYNYQNGSFVIGAQAGYDFADAQGNASAYPHNVSAQIDGFGSRGRNCV